MVVIPEILIQNVLAQGFDHIFQNPALIADMLKDYPAPYQAEATKYFNTHHVTVVLNWPRDPGLTLPIIGIVNAASAEQPGMDVLGDFMDRTYGDDVNIQEHYGFATQNTYSLFVSSQEPRLSIYVGLFTKFFLMLNRDTFLRNGFENQVINEGDLQFDSSMLPELQNPRVVSFSGLCYFTVPENEAILKHILYQLTPVVNPPEDEPYTTLFLPGGGTKYNYPKR